MIAVADRPSPDDTVARGVATSTWPGRGEGPLPAVIGAAPAAEALGDGRTILLVDEAGRWPAHVVVAASRCRAEDVTFMARWARGVVGLALTAEHCDRLGLRSMGRLDRRGDGLDYTVSIEARDGVSTGISAADRARTVAVAVAPGSGPLDLVVPGHVFPLRAAPGGIGVRPGPVEAAVELARLGGTGPTAVVCAVLDEDGEVAARPYLRGLAARFALPVVSISQVARGLAGTRELHQLSGTP